MNKYTDEVEFSKFEIVEYNAQDIHGLEPNRMKKCLNCGLLTADCVIWERVNFALSSRYCGYCGAMFVEELENG